MLEEKLQLQGEYSKYNVSWSLYSHSLAPTILSTLSILSITPVHDQNGRWRLPHRDILKQVPTIFQIDPLLSSHCTYFFFISLSQSNTIFIKQNTPRRNKLGIFNKTRSCSLTMENHFGKTNINRRFVLLRQSY